VGQPVAGAGGTGIGYGGGGSGNILYLNTSIIPNPDYPSRQTEYRGCPGGGGGWRFGVFEVSPGESIVCNVGVGGAGGSGYYGADGGDGADGVCIIEW